jgi:hypothetical protein
MAAPATTYQVCQAFHDRLLQEGRAGQRIPRSAWDQAWVMWTKRSSNQVRNYTETGKMAGFWQVVPGRGPGNEGYVIPLEPMTIAVATPTAAPQAA